MRLLELVLAKLAGKKATIVAVLALVLTYLQKEQLLSDNLTLLLNGILVVLAGGANISGKILGARKQ